MMKATVGFAIGLVLTTGGLAAAQLVTEVQPAAPVATAAAPAGMQRVSQLLG
jgi:hypothetical protein